MSTTLKMSKAVSLAFHSMVYLAEDPENLHSTREISEAICCSEHHLARIMIQLSRMRLVNSSRGPKGGFVLAEAPEDITLQRIYEAIEGPIATDRCFLDRENCRYDGCIFEGLQEAIYEKAENYLKNTTLAKVLEDAKNGAGTEA